MEIQIHEEDEFEKLNSLKNTEYTRRLLANKQVFYDLQRRGDPHGMVCVVDIFLLDVNINWTQHRMKSRNYFTQKLKLPNAFWK